MRLFHSNHSLFYFLREKLNFKMSIRWFIYYLFSGIFVFSNNVSLDYFSLNEGLSQSSVNCIYQDVRGFIWLGTQDGLNRFDGYDFKIYKKNREKKGSLPDNFITALYEDSSGTFWIGSRGGLSVFDFKSQEFTNYLNDYIVLSIVRDSRGRLWVGTEQHGIIVFNSDMQIQHELNHHPDQSSSLINNTIRSICPGKSSSMWVGTDTGICLIDVSDMSCHDYSSGDTSQMGNQVIEQVYMDSKGQVWVAAEKGLFKYVSQNDNFIRVPLIIHNSLVVSEHVSSLAEGINNRMWAGTDSGILTPIIYNEQSKLSQSKNNNDESIEIDDHITSLLFDQSGLIWGGTDNIGLFVLNPEENVFHVLEHIKDNNSSLIRPSVRAIIQTTDGVVWVGTDDGGVTLWNKEKNSFTHYVSDGKPGCISSNEIRCFTIDSLGRIWVGTVNGLNRYDSNTDSFIQYFHSHDDVSTISHDHVRALAPGENGNVWVGTHEGISLYSSETNSFKGFYHKDADGSLTLVNKVWTLYPEPVEKTLWIGSDGGGLARLDTETGVISLCAKDHDKKLSSRIFSIITSTSGKMWLGTFGDGLIKFDPHTGKMDYYREENGLPNDVVYSVLEDNHGCIWMGTNRGLCSLDPRNGKYRHFLEKDGIQGNEFNQGAFYKSPDDCLFLGGVNGLTWFNPNNIKDDTEIPQVVITDFMIFNQSVPISENKHISPLKESSVTVDSIEVDYSQSLITFEFAALYFKNPQRVTYAYKLEGWDKDWLITDSDRRSASYTRIDPGNYTFFVKAANKDGIWNNNPTSVALKVLPPFWKTPAAYTLYIILCAGIIIAFIRFQRHKVIIKELELQKAREYSSRLEEIDRLKDIHASELEEKVKERTKELLEKTEELLHSNEAIQKSHEEILQLEKRTAALAAAVTANHEIKQPLTVLQGALDLLSEQLKHSEQPADKQVSLIDKCSKSIYQITDILDKFATSNDIKTETYYKKSEMVQFLKKEAEGKK